MPLQKLEFRPGVNREGTTLANEGGWFESDKVRFRSGYPEKIGGWVIDTGPNNSTLQPATGTVWGIVRGMWNWFNLTGYNLLALGTNLKYYIQNGPVGSFYDITPIRETTAAGGVTFSAVTTAPYSTTITVTDSGHGAQVGDFVTFSGAAGLGGNITALILNKEYQVATYINSSQYTIVASVSSNASDTGTGGASTVGQYQISTGSDIFTVGVGWGAGGWGGSTGPTATTTLNGALATVGNTILSTDITAAATTIGVASTATLAASGSVLIDSEIITYSGVTATSLTGCGRGATATVAATHVASTGVIQYATSTINVASASTFTSSGTFAVDGEVISYSGKTGTSFTGCVRGYAGFVTAHANGASVAQYASTATGWGSPAPASQGVGVQLRLWSQSNFGEDLVFNPRGGALYYWANNASANTFDRGQLLGPSSTIVTKTGSISVDAYCPSVANFVTVSDSSRFVIAFGCNDAVAGSSVQNPMFIAWSDQENFATWYPQVTNQAGSYQLSHGSKIVTAIQTRQEILVLTDSAVYSMQYLGPPYVWSFQIMGDNISIMGPNAITTVNNVTYWMGTDKFYMYTGRVETLPCSLRQYVYDDINISQAFQFFAGTNEGYNEVWWFYCSADSNLIDKYVIFNHLERTWYYGTLARTAWLDSPLRDSPMGAGYGFAQFNGAISGTTLTISSVYKGAVTVGSVILGSGVAESTTITAFGTGTGGLGTYTLNRASTVADEIMLATPTQSSGILVYHENGNDDGTTNPATPIEAYVQSSDFDIGDGHNFGLVTRIIPDVTFDGSTVNSPSLDFTVRPRQFPGTNYGTADSPTVTSAQNYSSANRTYNVQQFTQQVFVRVRGRQMAFRVVSNDLGVAWQLGVPRIDTRPDGRR